jgi:hypothetical protein
VKRRWSTSSARSAPAILVDGDVGAGVDLVPFDDVVLGNFLAVVGVDLDVFDAVAGVLVLVEADVLALRPCRKGLRAGHQGKAQKAFPIGVGHRKKLQLK